MPFHKPARCAAAFENGTRATGTFAFVGEHDDPGTATFLPPPAAGRKVTHLHILKETAGYTRAQGNMQHLDTVDLRAASAQASLLLLCTRTLGNGFEGDSGRGKNALMNQCTLHSAHTESIKKHKRLGENKK